MRLHEQQAAVGRGTGSTTQNRLADSLPTTTGKAVRFPKGGWVKVPQARFFLTTTIFRL
jgi:hypothetical protein